MHADHQRMSSARLDRNDTRRRQSFQYGFQRSRRDRALLIRRFRVHCFEIQARQAPDIPHQPCVAFEGPGRRIVQRGCNYQGVAALDPVVKASGFLGAHRQFVRHRRDQNIAGRL
jgi:hypothetical protein